jgi:hypothetical protein
MATTLNFALSLFHMKFNDPIMWPKLALMDHNLSEIEFLNKNKVKHNVVIIDEIRYAD